MQLLLGIAFAIVLVALALAIFVVQVPAIQGGIVGGLIGLLSSQVALLVGRYLRERGEVLLEIKDGWAGSERLDVSKEYISQASDFELAPLRDVRAFEVRLRNTKEVVVSLWDFSVVFSRGEEHLASLTPHLAATGQPLDLLNIPPKVAVSHVVRISVSKDAAMLRKVWRADKVEMTVTVAGEGQLSAALPRWTEPDAV